MYVRLLVESLRRGTRRKLLAVTAVALGTLGATALAEVMLASGDRLAAELAAYGANLAVAPAAGRETLPVAELSEVRKIFWRNNIVAVAPTYALRLRLASSGGAVVAPVVGTWFDYALEPHYRSGLPRTRPTLQVAGRWPHDDAAGAVEAVLGRRLAARLNAGTGSTLAAELGGRSARLAVVGVVTSGGEEDEQAFVPLDAVARMAGHPGRFTRAEIFALTNPESRNVRDPKRMSAKEYDAWYCTAYPSSVAYQIGQAMPDATASVVHGITSTTADVLGRLRGVLLTLALVALLGAAIGVAATMTATVLERRLEAGLLVAIGAARGRVVLFFLSEAALLGLLGGVAGGALGLPAGRLLGSGAFAATVPALPVLLPFAVAAGIAVAVLASVLPVVRALGRYPALLLKRATA